MEHFDYVVVGAGIEGSWTAYQLIKEDPKPSVLLLDRFPLPHCRGSSHGQSRIIRHAYAESFHTELMPTAFREWRQLEKDSSTNLLISKPLLCVADETGYEVLDKTIDCLRKEQVKEGNDISFQELSFQELREKFPQANFAPNQRGFLEHSAGILFADKCMATVQSQFKALGGIIKDAFLVESVEPGDKIKIKGQRQGREINVTASKVAMCLGPWTKKCIDPLLPNQKLPLKTYRVPVFYWKIKENGRGVIPVIYKDRGSGDFWSIPEIEYKNMVKYSSNNILYEVDPDERDKNCSDEPIPPKLAEHIRSYFPGMEETPSIVETCMYTSTPDEVSIIDLIPGHSNIAYACGFSGSGFKKAPCVGIMLKEMLQSDPNKTFDPKPFSLSRF